MRQIVVTAKWVLVALGVVLWIVVVPLLELGRAVRTSLVRRVKADGREMKDLDPEEQAAAIAAIHEQRRAASVLERIRRRA